MLHQTQLAPATAELLGDLRPLIERIGSSESLAALAGASDSSQLRQITTPENLRAFLQDYQTRILLPLELPSIQRAFNHAARNELRELLAYDSQLADDPARQNFAEASRHVGQTQLQRLRPLRDLRLVQRYIAAVTQGKARGWHTLVYGITLTVYSLPLRQGLCGYAIQTTRGFIQAAAPSVGLSENAASEMLAELSLAFPAAVDALLIAPVIS